MDAHVPTTHRALQLVSPKRKVARLLFCSVLAVQCCHKTWWHCRENTKTWLRALEWANSVACFLSHIWYVTTMSTNRSGCALRPAHLLYCKRKTVHHHSDKSTKLWPWGRFTSRALKMPARHSTHSAARSSSQSLTWNPNSRKGTDKLLCYPTGCV